MNEHPDESDASILALLERTKRIAILGLSDKPHRDSHRVAAYLLRAGYEVIPVNPMIEQVLGLPSRKSLAEIDGHVDLVNVFRQSDAVPEIVTESIRMGAGAIWLQLGVVHEQATAAARAAGLQVVEDRCIKVEHARLVER